MGHLDADVVERIVRGNAIELLGLTRRRAVGGAR